MIFKALILLFTIVRAELFTEARVPLNEKAFQRIKNSFPLKSKERQDIYFDLYDGKNFLFENSLSPIKLRIKESKSKITLQLSDKQINKKFEKCGDFYILISQKNSFESELSTKALNKIKSLNFSIVKEFAQNSGHALFLIDQRDQIVTQAIDEGRDIFLQSRPNSHHLLIEKNMAQRIKYELIKNFYGKSFILSLKQSMITSISGNDYSSYEIEIQPEHEDEWTLADFSEASCQTMLELNLSKNDLSLDFHPEYQDALNYYRNLNQLLGF
ncbi:MAG: hypothetical protein Fur0010_09140 [Bdellovibrio sp.]